MAINKKSNEIFKVEDMEMMINIAAHVALNLEGEGSSIKKVLGFTKSSQKAMEQRYDFVRTKTYVKIIFNFSLHSVSILALRRQSSH